VHTTQQPTTRSCSRTPALLTSGEAGATEYIHADLRDTDAILSQAGQLLDFTKPVAVTLLAVLHVIPDADDPHAIVAKLTDCLPPCSYLAISHGGTDLVDRSKQESFQSTWNGKVQQPFAGRTREQVARFFTGLDLVEPGLVPVEEWRPTPVPAKRTAPLCGAQWRASAEAVPISCRRRGPGDY
jgi:S-adenosyl methyltransferase